MNVLIVEDCEITRLVIARTLEISGIPLDQIYHASNGVEGLSCLREKEVGLVIVDNNMPVMNGIEMLERVDKRIPVLTITAESNPGCISLLQQKSSGFVHKPFTAETLRDKVLAVLRIHSGEKKNGFELGQT